VTASLTAKVTALTRKVEEQFPTLIADFRAKVDSNNMHTQKMEKTVDEMMENVRVHGETMRKSYDDIAEVTRMRVEDVEKALKKRDQNGLAMQENIQGISKQFA